ncbi:S-layer homology domain-containing protein [uncultured Megasphaera sp.]|uniref:S-layer homology domain-containing protein n=1 Tax=uncultured Megasphaera sp. TaxID=165188 RepID=UPI0026700700|nr:S-layer homology domain-containing protein [uncultured Megasphaera sp.]
MVEGKKADGTDLYPKESGLTILDQDKASVTLDGLVISKGLVRIHNLSGLSGDGDGTIKVGHVVANNELRTHGYLVVGGQETNLGTATVMDQSASIGSNNQISAPDSTGIGVLNTIYGDSSLVAGYKNTGYSYGSLAMGRENKSYASYAFAGGYGSVAGNKRETDLNTETGISSLRNNMYGWNAFAYGYMAQAIGSGSAALGVQSEALGYNSFAAAGGKTTAEAENGVALGAAATAALSNSVALGSGTVANTAKGVAGYDPSTGKASTETGSAWKSTAAAVSVGNASKNITRQITGVAAGSEDTDAVNVAQLKALQATMQSSSGGSATHYYSVNSTEQGEGSNYNNDGAAGTDSLAAGVKAKAQGTNSVAIGTGAVVGSAVSKGDNGIAIGNEANGRRDNSVAIGTKTQAGTSAVAIGEEANAYNEGTVAIGKGALSNQADAVAIGDGSKSIGKNGIALGAGAVAGAEDSNWTYGNIAIGTKASSAGGVAIGDEAKAGSFGLAAGLNSEAGDRAAAVGYADKATGTWSSALGVGNTAEGEAATAVGNGNTVSGKNAVAVGVKNTVAQENTYVLGSNVTTTQVNSVVLGADSADRAATQETQGSIPVSDGTVTYGGFAGTKPVGVVSVGAKDKERQIINVAAGKVSADSTDAINGSQLYGLSKIVGGNYDSIKELEKRVTEVSGEAGAHTTVKAGENKNLTVTEGTNDKGGKEYTVDLSDELNIGGAGKDGKDGKDRHIGVNGKDGKSGVGIDGKDGISVKGDIGEVGINGNDGISIKGEDGKNAVAINGKDGVGHIGLTGPAGTNGKDGTSAVDISVKNGYDGKDGVKGATGVDGKDGITRIVYEDKNGEHQVATLDDGMKYGGDTGDVIAKKLNNQVNVIGGITDTVKLTGEDNIGVVSDGKDNLKVRLAKDLNGITSISNGGNTTISLEDNSVNMNGSKITNVGDGNVAPGSKDVVNGGQLYETNQNIGRMGQSLNKLGNRINRVGAGAAALAALHPQDFDPDDKWDFAVGYGNYRNANAAAVGAFYRPTEDVMFSVGGSFGGGENMVNAGVTFKLGQKNGVSTSRVAMAKEILELKKENQDLKNTVTTLVNQNKQIIKALNSGNTVNAIDFPDVPKDHWAYEYVKALANQGYLKGYPDGEFKGDRAMTRYEYAALLYRAMQNGAPLDGKMAKAVEEFGPELESVQKAARFRVDRISGKDNDRNKVERVRVNDADNKAEKDFRDVYGSRIVK